MTVGLCTGPLGPVEDARQAPMEDVGAHLQGGDAHQGEKHSNNQNTLFVSFTAPEGTGGHPAPAGGGAPVQDTGVMLLFSACYPARLIFLVCETLIFPGGVALLCSGGDLPLPGGETTGDKMIAFQSCFVWETCGNSQIRRTFSFVKNQWRSEHPNKPAITLYPIVTCRSFWSYLALVIRGPLPSSSGC